MRVAENYSGAAVEVRSASGVWAKPEFAWAGKAGFRWRALAAIELIEASHWTEDMLARVFNGPDEFPVLMAYLRASGILESGKRRRTSPKRSKFWNVAAKLYADGPSLRRQDSRIRWKRMAMFSLRVNSHWSLTQIGFVFGHHRGHVLRSIEFVRHGLRDALPH